MTSKLLSARLRSALCAASLLAPVATGHAQSQQLPVVELGAGMYRVQAELAHTDRARQIGLMNRRSMPAQHGMVFVFERDARHCMWMKNTLLPLSVAFLDARGRVLNVERMQPQTEDSHCAAAPARFALEMNLGWFEERGIRPGDTIRGIDALPPAR